MEVIEGTQAFNDRDQTYLMQKKLKIAPQKYLQIFKENLKTVNIKTFRLPEWNKANIEFFHSNEN